MKSVKIFIIFILTAIKNEEGLGNFVLLDRGIKPYLENSMALTFYATILCDMQSQQLTTPERTTRLKMILCCQIKSMNKVDDEMKVDELEKNPNWDCQSMKIYSGLAFHLHPNQTSTLTAFFLNKHLLNRKGICTFKINEVDSVPPFSINFDTRVTENLSLPSGQKTVACESLDQDPVRNCEPIDCITKYGGFRSFFNWKSQECVPTPTCHEQEGKETEHNLTELHRLEHHPILVLDLDTNKCVNKSTHVKAPIKSRSTGQLSDADEVPSGYEKVSSVQAFTAAYGLTLTKLGIAILLTCVFVLVVCVMIHFCFGYWCACCPRSDNLGEYGHQYKRIIDDCDQYCYHYYHPPESDKSVIQNIKDRREPKPPPTEDPNSGLQNSERSTKPIHSSSTKPPSPPQSLPKTPSNRSQNNPAASPPPAKTPSAQSQPKSPAPANTPPQPSESSQSTKRLPNVVQFLQQIHNFRQKRSNKPPREYIDLSWIYGRPPKVVSLDTESTITFKRRYEDEFRRQDYPSEYANEPRDQMINMGSTPKFNQVIHKIQQENQQEFHKPRNPNRVSSRPKRAVQRNVPVYNEIPRGQMTDQGNQVQENTRRNLPTQAQLPSWASVSSFDTNDSVYRQEMTDALNFMKELNSRQSPTIETTQVSPRQDPHQLMRRIKDEPPIPMSMIYKDAKFNEIPPSYPDRRYNYHNHHQTRATSPQRFPRSSNSQSTLPSGQDASTSTTNPSIQHCEVSVGPDWTKHHDFCLQELTKPEISYATMSTSCKSRSKPEHKNQQVQVSTPSRSNLKDKSDLLTFESNSEEQESRQNHVTSQTDPVTRNVNFGNGQTPSGNNNSLKSPGNCPPTEAYQHSEKFHKFIASNSCPPAVKSNSCPHKDEKSLCNFVEFPEFVYNLPIETPKTNAAEKIFRSALRLQQEVYNSDVRTTTNPAGNCNVGKNCDLFDHRQAQLERGDSNYEMTNEDFEELEEMEDGNKNNYNVFKMMQKLNDAENLGTHSPPTLTCSELSCDGSSGSDLPTRVLKHEQHFWDDEFQPGRRPSQSDQALQRPLWIDNFVIMPKPKGNK